MNKEEFQVFADKYYYSKSVIFFTQLFDKLMPKGILVEDKLKDVLKNFPPNLEEDFFKISSQMNDEERYLYFCDWGKDNAA